MAIIDLDIKIKQAVQTWRERNYDRASPVNKRLLEFWFKEVYRTQSFRTLVSGVEIKDK